MKPAPALRVVDEAPRDVTLLLRAEIAARDWASVHIAGDKRQPVNLPDGKRWGWR